LNILAAADLHVGCNRTFDPNLDRPRAALTEILALIRKEKPDVVTLAGDIFDHGNPTHEERVLISEFFRDCTSPIIAITGTHDRYGKELHQTALDWLVRLANKLGHRVIDEPTALEFVGAWWVAIPSNRWKQTDLDLMAHFFADRVPKSFSGPVIGLSHEFYQGAKTEYFSATNKHAQLPEVKRVDMWLLGDIHNVQKIRKNAWYSGAVYQTDFGESLPKGVLRILEGEGPEFCELTTPTQLVTLTEVPRRWPEDCYIKVRLPSNKIPRDMPDNVVAVESLSVKDETVISAESLKLNNPLSGLKEWLSVTKKLPEKQLKFTMALAKDLYQRVR